MLPTHWKCLLLLLVFGLAGCDSPELMIEIPGSSQEPPLALENALRAGLQDSPAQDIKLGKMKLGQNGRGYIGVHLTPEGLNPQQIEKVRIALLSHLYAQHDIVTVSFADGSIFDAAIDWANPLPMVLATAPQPLPTQLLCEYWFTLRPIVRKPRPLMPSTSDVVAFEQALATQRLYTLTFNHADLDRSVFTVTSPRRPVLILHVGDIGDADTSTSVTRHDSDGTMKRRCEQAWRERYPYIATRAKRPASSTDSILDIRINSK